jgi:hypothetical protein
MKQNHFWMGMVILAIAGCGTTSGMMPGKPPVIQTILAESTDVTVGANIRIKARIDSKSGGLDYAWLADRGLITAPNEATTIWIAPESIPFSPYPVLISLTVEDEYGRSVKANYQIRVHQQGLSPL